MRKMRNTKWYKRLKKDTSEVYLLKTSDQVYDILAIPTKQISYMGKDYQTVWMTTEQYFMVKMQMALSSWQLCCRAERRISPAAARLVAKAWNKKPLQSIDANALIDDCLDFRQRLSETKLTETKSNVVNQ